MKNIFLIFLLITTAHCIAQDIDPANRQYLRVKNPYTFDFPMFNLSMELPKNAGFRVPFWNINNAFLQVDNKNATYFYDTNSVDNDEVTFSYILPKENADFTLSFKHFSSDQLEQIKNLNAFIIPNIPGIQSEFGTFKCIARYFVCDLEVRKYYLIKDDLLISYAITSAISKTFKKCEKIIASLHYSDLTEKQNRYLELVSSGYFEEKKDTETETFDNKVDTTSAETTFSFPAFGLKMTYPENWETTIRSTESSIKKKKNTTEVNWTLEDINKQGFLMFDGRNKNILVMKKTRK